MSFELVAYEKLKKSIFESIKSLILYYDRDHKIDPDNIKKSLEILPQERRIQSEVFLRTIELLDPLSNELLKQTKVLNAITCYFRANIKERYRWTSPTHSNFFNSLTTSLDITLDKEPNKNDLFEMYTALDEFLRSHVYKESNPRKGYLESQYFDIEGYNVVTDIGALKTKLKEFEQETLLDAEELRIKQQKPGNLGLFGGGSSADKASKKEEKAAVSSVSPH